MHPFTYTRAGNSTDAIAGVSGDPASAYLAGGTTLLDLMKLHVMTPSKLVDINRLPLEKIEPLPGGGLRIGAMARNSNLAWNETVRKQYPLLSQALLAGASAQLRNMASVGGNLVQRTRCPYFRDGISACNKRQPGSGCAMVEGFNRLAAVLGTSEKCVATHPSDMAVALLSLDATVQVAGAKGERTVKIADFHLLPGDSPEKETVLEHGELITAVDLPAIEDGSRQLYVKVRDRASYEFALASVAAAVWMNADGTIRRAAISLGGVATKPWRSADAEKVLAGAKPGEAAFSDAAAAALNGASALKYNGFKVELARRAIVRTLTELTQPA